VDTTPHYDVIESICGSCAIPILFEPVRLLPRKDEDEEEEEEGGGRRPGTCKRRLLELLDGTVSGSLPLCQIREALRCRSSRVLVLEVEDAKNDTEEEERARDEEEEDDIISMAARVAATLVFRPTAIDNQDGRVDRRCVTIEARGLIDLTLFGATPEEISDMYDQGFRQGMGCSGGEPPGGGGSGEPPGGGRPRPDDRGCRPESGGPGRENLELQGYQTPEQDSAATTTEAAAAT